MKLNEKYEIQLRIIDTNCHCGLGEETMLEDFNKRNPGGKNLSWKVLRKWNYMRILNLMNDNDLKRKLKIKERDEQCM